MTAAYYDFFRKITLQPDGVTLEADSVSDTLTITGGNGVAFNPNVSADSFEIDVNYQLFVPIGSTKIRLNDINSNYTDITMTAGSNMSVGRNSANELVFTSTVGGTSKAVSGATQASPVVITTNTQHQFTEGIAVTITDIVGMTELNGNEYYMDILTSQTFALYTDSNLTTPLNGTGFTAYGSGGVAVAEYSAPQALSQLSDVDLIGTPPVNGTYLQYNGTSWQAGTTLAGDLTGSVFADDSTLLVDGVGGKVMLTTNTTTELTEGTNLYYTDVRADARIVNAGSANWNTAFGWGNHTGGGYAPQTTTYTKTEVNSAISAINTLDGDLTGSVFADDSTLLVDGISGTIPASVLEGTATINTTGLHTGVVTGDLTGSVFGADSTVIVDAGYGRLAVGGITIGPFTAPVATDPTESYVQPANMAQVNGSLHVLGGPSGVSGGSGGYYSTFDKGIRVLGELRAAGLFRSSLSTNFMPSSNFPTGVTALKMNYESSAPGSGTWYMYQPAVGVTTNLTGLSEFNDYTTTVNITIYQGSTAVLPPLQIDGVSTGIAWEFNVIPTPTPSSYTVIEYKIMRIANNWYVLGHMGLYG
jgi:hypothetical protein